MAVFIFIVLCIEILVNRVHLDQTPLLSVYVLKTGPSLERLNSCTWCSISYIVCVSGGGGRWLGIKVVW